MPEGTILTAISVIVSTLAGVIAVLWKKAEGRWERAIEDLKLTQAEALRALQHIHDREMERVSALYKQQIETALSDTRDYKEMLRVAIRSGNKALEVGAQQAKRNSSGGEQS